MRRKFITVVRQLGGIGDVLMMSCLYRGLKENYPKHKIRLITGRVYLSGALHDVAVRNPFIDEIHIIEPYEATTRRTTEVWNRFYGGCGIIDDDPLLTTSDHVFDMNTACVDYEWVAMKSVDGIQKPRWQIWCDHAGVVPSSYMPVYQMTTSDKAMVKKFKSEWSDKRVVGIAVAACDSRRAMPIGMIKNLIARLNDNGITPCIIDPTWNAPGALSINNYRLSDVMCAIAAMDAVITPDTGVLHMSGAVGTPVIGIFGPTDAKMRMNDYTGSFIDSRVVMPCAPCWYEYPCLKSKNKNEHFACVNKLDASIIVEETMRWVK